MTSKESSKASDTIIVVENAIGREPEDEENLDLILSGPDFDSIYYSGGEDDGAT